MGQVMNRGRRRRAPGVLFLLWLPALPLWSQTTPGVPTSLGSLVPSDSVFYLHYNLESTGGLSDRLDRFRESLAGADFFDAFTEAFLSSLEDLRDVLKERAAEEPNERARERLAAEVERIDAEIRRRGLDGTEWERILGGIEWWKLLEREVAVAARVEGERQREWLLAFRSTETERDQRLRELQQALYGLGAVIPGLELLVSERSGVPLTVLYSVFSPGEELCIGGFRDVVLVATSRGLLRRACQLAEGRGSDLGLTRLPRFAEAIENLSHSRKLFPENAFSAAGFQLFVEPARLLHDMPGMRGLRAYALAGDLTDGEIVYSSTVRFDEELEFDADQDEEGPEDDSSSPPPHEVFLKRPAISDFAQFVPPDVEWFSATSGSDPELLGDFLVTLMRQSMLVDEASLAQFDLESDELAGRIRAVLLGQLTGRRAVFRRHGAWAAVWELARPLRAAEDAWKELLDSLAGVGFKPSPAGSTFRETTVPVFGPLGLSFTVGTLDDVLVVASGTTVLETIREARSGAATIASDAGFSSLWPQPSGELHTVSYGNAALLVAWLEAVLRAGPGILGGAASVEDSMLGPLLGAVQRLAPAIGKLDFLGTSIAWTVRNGLELQGAGRIKLTPEASSRGF